MQVVFKKAFLKDFEQLPAETKQKVASLVFEEIPKLDSLNQLHKLKKLTGFRDFYRIRRGAYRLGVKYHEGIITLYRVLHRKEIYRDP